MLRPFFSPFSTSPHFAAGLHTAVLHPDVCLTRRLCRVLHNVVRFVITGLDGQRQYVSFVGDGYFLVGIGNGREAIPGNGPGQNVLIFVGKLYAGNRPVVAYSHKEQPAFRVGKRHNFSYDFLGMGGFQLEFKVHAFALPDQCLQGFQVGGNGQVGGYDVTGPAKEKDVCSDLGRNMIGKVY